MSDELTQFLNQSDVRRKETSMWLSTALGDSGECKVEQYIGAEVITGQFGEQLVLTLVVAGEERKLARPFPLSKAGKQFIEEVNAVKDAPFIVSKKLNAKGNPVYNARKFTQEPAQAQEQIEINEE